MLPFGSFFTQVPLLIIGLLYVVYLGLNVVNKEKPKLSEENLQFIEISNDSSIVDYFTLATSLADKPEPCIIVPSDFFLFSDKEGFPIPSSYDVNIFARPPPEA